VTNPDVVRERFGARAPQLAALQQRRAAALAERLRRFVVLRGDERVLDAGSGAGALAMAVAPFVREVVAVDLVPELLEEGRRLAHEMPNVTFVDGDLMHLPGSIGDFDLAGCLRVLHHISRPELAVAELSRVTRPGGRILVADYIAPSDPLAAFELNRFERARDPSHARTLADVDLRGLFDANGLVLRRAEFDTEERDVDEYLDRAGCAGEERETARSLVPPAARSAVLGWYLLAKPGL
jgi:SAM-dependent methyltransferase